MGINKDCLCQESKQPEADKINGKRPASNGTSPENSCDQQGKCIDQKERDREREKILHMLVDRNYYFSGSAQEQVKYMSAQSMRCKQKCRYESTGGQRNFTKECTQRFSGGQARVCRNVNGAKFIESQYEHYN